MMSQGEPRVPFCPLKDSQIFCTLQKCFFLSSASSATFMFHLCFGLQRSDGVLQPGPQLWLYFLGVPSCFELLDVCLGGYVGTPTRMKQVNATPSREFLEEGSIPMSHHGPWIRRGENWVGPFPEIRKDCWGS